MEPAQNGPSELAAPAAFRLKITMTVLLTYHDVAPGDELEDVGFPGPLAARYKLTPDRFQAHLDTIGASGRSVGLLSGEDAAPQVVLTFDDGSISALGIAEALERRQWRGHFLVTTGRIGTAGFLDPDGILELQRRGHAVGSHSHTHPTYMGKLSRAEIDDEWRRSRKILAELLGGPPVVASVPGGYLTRDVVASAAAAGYGLLFTSEPGTRSRRQDGMTVVDRYTIWATTTTARVAGYVNGSFGAHARLWLEWKAKRAVKRVSPKGYDALRRIRARRP